MRTTIALLAFASLVPIAAAQHQAPKATPAPKQALPTVVQPQALGFTNEEVLEVENYQLKKQLLDQRVTTAEDSLLNEYVAKASAILAKHHLTNIIIDRQSFNLLRTPGPKPAPPPAAATAKPLAK